MIRPDEEDKPFVVRWNSLMSVLLVDPSVKQIGILAGIHADWQDGTSCRPSIERLARMSGFTPPTVRHGWAVLRGLELADRVERGIAHLRRADVYELQIPSNWMSLPLLGPRAGKFICLHCQRLFNPPGHSILNELPEDKIDGGDKVRFNVARFCFCPPPKNRKSDGALIRTDEACLVAWNRDRKKRREPLWNEPGGEEPWKMFRKARDDEW